MTTVGRVLAVLATLAVAVLAGCTDDGSSSSSSEAGGGAEDGILAPTWSIGDSWTFENTDAAGNTSSMAIIVTGEDGADYIVDTNEPTVAYYDAMADISYLGKVRKSDLAGSQGSDRVQYFNFPLEVGKTWSTAWDGERVDVEVTQIASGEVSLAATTAGRAFADYTYSVADRFIGAIDFYDENGTMSYRMELSDSAQGFSGTVYRYTLHDVMEYTIGDAGAESAEIPFGDDVNEAGFQGVATCNGAPAGQMGAVVSEKAPDDPHVPQLVVATDDPVFFINVNCAEAQRASASGVAPIDPAQAYYIDHGAAAEGGTVTITVEPRTLDAIPVGGG